MERRRAAKQTTADSISAKLKRLVGGNNMSRLPFNIVMFIVWLYWISVVVMIVRSRMKLREEAGALPRSARERWMWLLWVPTVIGWQVIPGLGYMSTSPLLRPLAWAIDHPYHPVNWLAVAAAITAYVFTVPCWLAMGANWSLAIVPDKQTSLVTEGFYSKVRHPIYALGILLMAATLVVAPSPAMLLIGISHFALALLKSVTEEQFLKQKHGQSYLDYCRRTWRFVPLPARTN
jgi:protein-S-isoprenylcysteine O-methyltransferase Ste14